MGLNDLTMFGMFGMTEKIGIICIICMIADWMMISLTICRKLSVQYFTCLMDFGSADWKEDCWISDC